MKKNNKGFTLAELLIVVAIIAVLVAIAIPIFTAQLEKSRDAVTASNLRSAYAEATATKLLQENSGRAVYDTAAGTVKVTGVKIKGEDDNGGLNPDKVDLAFTLTDTLKAAADKAADDDAKNKGISVVFSWDDTTSECTADVAS